VRVYWEIPGVLEKTQYGIWVIKGSNVIYQTELELAGEIQSYEIPENVGLARNVEYKVSVSATINGKTVVKEGVGRISDADGDGLPDAEETAGWVVRTYRYPFQVEYDPGPPSGRPFYTQHVTSSWYIPDTDGDGWLDSMEKKARTLPFNPYFGVGGGGGGQPPLICSVGEMPGLTEIPWGLSGVDTDNDLSVDKEDINPVVGFECIRVMMKYISGPYYGFTVEVKVEGYEWLGRSIDSVNNKIKLCFSVWLEHGVDSQPVEIRVKLFGGEEEKKISYLGRKDGRTYFWQIENGEERKDGEWDTISWSIGSISVSIESCGKDQDGDGLWYWDEVYTYFTNPVEEDTDCDLMRDGNEIRLGLNPLQYDNPFGDYDNDGFVNLIEVEFLGTYPSSFTKKYGLFVGACGATPYQDTIPPHPGYALKYADNTAYNFYTDFVANGWIPQQNARAVIYQDSLCYGGEITGFDDQYLFEFGRKNQLLGHLDWLTSVSDGNCVIVFYYGGHGGRNLICWSIGGFSSDYIYEYELIEYFSRVKGAMIIYLDCCHAETLKELVYTSEIWGRLVMYACKEDQYGMEFDDLLSLTFGYYLRKNYNDNQWNCGVLAYYEDVSASVDRYIFQHTGSQYHSQPGFITNFPLSEEMRTYLKLR
ncbi:MAG: caspase family protein, partial [Candidatus Jordarchaeaceae archaeon]